MDHNLEVRKIQVGMTDSKYLVWIGWYFDLEWKAEAAEWAQMKEAVADWRPVFTVAADALVEVGFQGWMAKLKAGKLKHLLQIDREDKLASASALPEVRSQVLAALLA